MHLWVRDCHFLYIVMSLAAYRSSQFLLSNLALIRQNSRSHSDFHSIISRAQQRLVNKLAGHALYQMNS